MRMLIATPLYPPESGGPATYAALLSRTLPAQGARVSLARFSRVRGLPKVVRHAAYTCLVWTKALRADCVLALDPVSTGLPALIAARLSGRPFFLKVVGDYAWEQGRQRYGIEDTLDAFLARSSLPRPVRILQKIESCVAKSARRVIVPSEYLKGVVISWGVPASAIRVVYNAVEQAKDGTLPEEVSALPRPRIAVIGRLVPWKHVDGVIDAVAMLRQRGVSASLAIVGDGPESPRVKTHARDTLGTDYAFTGALPPGRAMAVLSDADLLVLNSSYEGLSHLLIEALVRGVPVVATRAGGNPELITDEETGLLVPAGDTEALVEACRRVLGDDTLKARISMQAREAGRRFTPETLAQETIAALTTA